jgi:hypothetical protein
MAASVLAAIFVALALLHFFWAAGGGAGAEGFVPSDGGQPLFTPGPLATVAVGIALLAAALVVTCRAGLFCIGLPMWMARVGIWVIALLFAARAVGDFRYAGFFKRVRGTRFAQRDTWIFSPLCAAIAALAAQVGLAP